MNEAEAIAPVWDALKELGFSPDSTVISDDMPGLSFDFGNFKLSASVVINKSFKPVVLFGGVLATPRTLTEVCFELPRMVASRQQVVAFLAYYLDKQASESGSVFHPAREVDWISEGRQNRHLLPWAAEMAAYRSRPHCSVQRDWLRLALKRLAELLGQLDAAAEVEIGFDGSVLLIRCSDEVVAMSAHGRPWRTQFTIPAGNLTHLPKRLGRDEIEISVWDGRLSIGRVSLHGAKEKMP
jgi:hypothetical protein